MRFSPRAWGLLSLALFAGAILCWLKGNQYEAERRLREPATGANTNQVRRPVSLLTPGAAGLPLASLSSNASRASASDPGEALEQAANPHRLRNTTKRLETLMREERAILLANALFDTASSQEVAIPEPLRSEGDPGSYIVQWHGPADAAFRAELAKAGASIVSYVPNNAYLVRATSEQSAQLQEVPGIQTVLPFEPYYKLEKGLLRAAVEAEALPEDLLLRITLFPGERDAGVQVLSDLGGMILYEEPSPFGPQVVVRPAADSLAAVARLPQVLAVEPDAVRMLASDLTRVRVGVSEDTVTNRNYLDLSGSNIWVNLNDTAVDPQHQDLEGRIFLGHPSLQPTDPEGHGTLVAGILGGNGEQSNTATNVPGSLTNAHYRGMATNVNMFVLPLESGADVNNHITDTYLTETAARTNYLILKRKNSLISNNSWTYSGVAEYDSSAARFDAAVRDALLTESTNQPILFVFAAGNGGFGNDRGSGGDPDSIFSPATAKNVLTIGALEQPRFITIAYTNYTVLTNFLTNVDNGTVTVETNKYTNAEPVFPYFSITDSGEQIAPFSSRGNVGIGTEGLYGRFKPDLVVPGTMMVGAKSRDWDVTNSLGNLQAEADAARQAGDTNRYNALTNTIGVFTRLQAGLGEYRMDSGTTYATPVVSGLLALFQEFFESRAATPLKREHLSPALMKALIINGARSLGENYDLQVRSFINYQGWGLPVLGNSLPTNLTASAEKEWSVRIIDQHPANALATGQSKTWTVTLKTNAAAYPLRATLVWTDPPGNPAVAIKLVNDLDLVVTNLDTGYVFHGNDIPGGSAFNQSLSTNDISNDLVEQLRDVVNNVENIFIRSPENFGRKFSVTVKARRVNVSAVTDYLSATGRTNDVTQDFALVISSDMRLDGEEVFEEFTDPPAVPVSSTYGRPITMTNGLPLLEQRVGANASLIGTNGVTNQWNFYVFDNLYDPATSLPGITNGSNVAFVTFLPPELARPRALEADIDMYVSKDNRLLTLHPDALRDSFKSVLEGGSETIVFTNATPDDVFYIAVKAEDQQAAEFSLLGISTDLPLDEDRNGSRLIRMFPFGAVIPDGSPRRPQASTMIGIGINQRRVARVRATQQIYHENLGDLVGVLSHNRIQSVLNNHTLDVTNITGTNLLIYDDYTFQPAAGSRNTDGPGSLNQFTGSRITGAWLLNQIDNAPGDTGLVEYAELLIDPLQNTLLAGNIINGSASIGTPLYYPIDVPPGVTNMILRFGLPGGENLEAYLGRDELPTPTNYLARAANTPPNGGFELRYGLTNDPPVSAGTYFLMVYNPGPADPVDFTLQLIYQFGNVRDYERGVVRTDVPLLDDALAVSPINILDDRVVAGVEVGIRMRHPRSADTVLHLVSPQGTRLLLAENRGQTSPYGFGSTTLTNDFGDPETNVYRMVFTDDAPAQIKFVDFPNLKVDIRTIFSSSFEGSAVASYGPPAVITGAPGDWRTLAAPASGLRLVPIGTLVGQIVFNPRSAVNVSTTGGGAQGSARYVDFYNAGISRSVSNLVAGANYRLRFTHRTAATNQSFEVTINGRTWDFTATSAWIVDSLVFQAASTNATIQFMHHAAPSDTSGSFQWNGEVGSVVFQAAGATTLPVQVDVIELEGTGEMHVQPEEPLNVLEGERSLGDWRLEVWDTRRGAATPAPDIVRWDLRLTYSEPLSLAYGLTGGSRYPQLLGTNIFAQGRRMRPGLLHTNQVHYFFVETCANVTRAEILLAGSNVVDRLELLADRDGLPTGDPSRDDYVRLRNSSTTQGSPNGFAQFTISTNEPAGAVLVPGKRIYLAVRNRFIDDTNRYTLRVRFEGVANCTVAQPVRINRLQPQFGALSGFSALEMEEGDLFEVQVSAAAQSLTLNLSADDDAQIVLSKDVPPTRYLFDYRGDSPGSGSEELTVQADSAIPLTPGTWYARVLNNTLEPLSYSLTATGDILDETETIVLSLMDTGSGLSLNWPGTAGASYEVQYSSDLVHWTTFSFVEGAGDTVTAPLVGLDPREGSRFFRVIRN